jgi:hypothetical protein
VGLNTGTAGNYTGANAGTATVSFVSDASNVGNCGANCQLNLASQTVSVAGKVYAAAAASWARRWTSASCVWATVSVPARSPSQNTAAVAGLNDTLQASVSGLAGPSLPGSVATGMAAQGQRPDRRDAEHRSAGVFSQNGRSAS